MNLDLIAEHFGVHPELVHSKLRSDAASWARFTGMYLLRKAGVRVSSIAEIYNRKPGDVYYAVREVNTRLQIDNAYRKRFQQIEASLHP